MTTSRLEAFSDGVFAVAITLLIFNVQVPHVVDAELGRALLVQWPAYASYVSFYRSLLAAPVDPNAARARLPWFGLGLLGCLIAIAVAFASAPLSLALYALVAIYYLFDHLPTAERKPATSPQVDDTLKVTVREAELPAGAVETPDA